MKPIKSNLFNMIASMLIIAVGSAWAIGYVYQKTAAPIAEAKKLKTQTAISEVIGTFDNDPLAEKTAISGEDVELYPAREDGEITSVAVKASSNEGFGGKIELIMGILMDGTVSGYKIIEQNETPGLGTKVTEPKFSGQFVGLNAHDDNFDLKKDGGEIDAVTGATISSRAVVNAMKKAVSAYNKFAGAVRHE
ncbi:MAG: RnfABCDGE type electron transport complex subunit G [Alphaproteobacteria bacterium]|nr:RnfABCDGE type electron transport complex subunit G [Alphaproteobacteria bacterium]